MAKKKSRASRGADRKNGLGMTSMIDVVFLLLIFFMCATKFKVPEGSLRSFLPRERGQSVAPATLSLGCRLTLEFDEQTGQVICVADQKLVPPQTDTDRWGDFERHRDRPGPDLDFVKEHLELRKSTYTGQSDQGLPVVIEFEERVPYKYVVDLLDTCAKVDIEDIGFAVPEEVLE